jgi:hypothetical protein
MSKKAKKPKVRHFWGIDPVTKVEADTTQQYDRAKAKRDWLQELDEETDADDKWEEFIEQDPE